MNTHRALCILTTLLAFAGLAGARPARFPAYRDLLGRCDLVVVATPTATADTKERIDLPGVGIVQADSTTVGLSVVGVETKFRVSAVLKGKQSLKNFVLHHYREANKSDLPSINGPCLVNFDLSAPGSFLLFLVREPDGRYAPFDQTDPGLLSVQKLTTNTQDE